MESSGKKQNAPLPHRKFRAAAGLFFCPEGNYIILTV